MSSSNIRRGIYHLAAILFSVLILSTIALYNGYPMTFNHDSGLYIISGFTGEIRPDRPIIYGLLIAMLSFKYSLWLVVITQAFIVALVIYFIFRYMSSTEFFVLYYLGFIAFVAVFMGAGFEVGWLMPDVFTATTILCAAMLIGVDCLKPTHIAIISVIIVVSITVHNSHFYICILLCVVASIGYFFAGIRKFYTDAGIAACRIALVVLLALLSTLISATIHYQYGAGFKSSFGAPIFLMSNLIEMGVIDSYLAENCADNKYSLCEYRNVIPNDFLWSDNSPLKKTGGWYANEKEYTNIEKDLFTKPEYLFKVAYRSLIYTIKQFFNYDIVHVLQPSPLVKEAIRNNYPQEYSSYINSKQSNGTMNFGFINGAQNIIAALCLFLFLYLLTSNKLSKNEAFFLIFIVAGLLVNAWLCSMFSGVYPRYQTRVAWLMPLPVFLYLIKLRDLTSIKTLNN